MLSQALYTMLHITASLVDMGFGAGVISHASYTASHVTTGPRDVVSRLQ